MIRRMFGSPLESFNRLVPKDRGGRLVAADLTYGPHARHRLDLYALRDAATSPLPIVVFLYGGSWASGLRQGYAFAGRAFAAKGFLTAIPDYRLVPEVRFPAFLEDCAAAVRWVAGQAHVYGGDPRRIVLVGHSAGAYNAAMLALDGRWLGEQQLAGWAGLAGPYDFLRLSGPVTRAAFGAAPDLEATQPVTFARADAPPALLLHGGKDRTVGPRNSRVLAQRLTDAGAAVSLEIYPDLAHVPMVTSLALPFRRTAPVLADILAFARTVTGQA